MRSTRLAVNILRQWQQHSRRVAGGLPAQGRTDNPSAPGPLKPISRLFFCYRKTQLTHLSRPPPVVGNGVVDFFTPAPAPLKPIQTIQSRSAATFARYQAHVEQVSKVTGLLVCRWPNPNVQPLRGEENEQTNDTGGNRTVSAKLHQTCFRGRVRPQGTLEHSRSFRARKRDDEIVHFETSPTQRRDTGMLTRCPNLPNATARPAPP